MDLRSWREGKIHKMSDGRLTFATVGRSDGRSHCCCIIVSKFRSPLRLMLVLEALIAPGGGHGVPRDRCDG